MSTIVSKVRQVRPDGSINFWATPSAPRDYLTENFTSSGNVTIVVSEIDNLTTETTNIFANSDVFDLWNYAWSNEPVLVNDKAAKMAYYANVGITITKQIITNP